MKEFIRKKISSNITIHWLLNCVYKNPILFLSPVINSLIATKKLTGNFFPVKVQIYFGQSLQIIKSKSAFIDIVGTLKVTPWGNSKVGSSISIGNQARLIIDGDYGIGPNVHISLADNSKLYLGGKYNSRGSGITCDSRIMVEKSVSIGCDCIIAWDVFITDSDWHEIKGCEKTAPVSIGDHVWISHGVSVLKGSKVPSGSIVGAKSLVTKRFNSENSLIAGIPAQIIKNDVEWEQ